MAADVIKLKDKNGKTLYPQTVATEVYTDSNNRGENVQESLNSKVEAEDMITPVEEVPSNYYTKAQTDDKIDDKISASIINNLNTSDANKSLSAYQGKLLKDSIDNIEELQAQGYKYIGIAVPTTNPGTPEQNVFYIATQVGIYTYFNNLTVADGEVVIFKYDTVWNKEVMGAATADQVNKLGQYVENPEWVRVVTDSEDKILYGVKTDGKFYFGAGCPPQVEEFVQQLIDGIGVSIDILFATKVDKVAGKGLSTNDFSNSEKEVVDMNTLSENPEWLKVTTDSDGKILEGIRKNGTRVVNIPIVTPSSETESTENIEWLSMFIDKDNQIIYGVKRDGSFEFYKGVPSAIKKYIDSYIKQLPGDNDVFLRRTREQMELAYNLGYARQTDFNTPDHLPAGWIPPLVFLHISDTHGDPNKPQMKNAIKALNNLSVNMANKGRNASFLLHTGDIKSSNFTDDFSYFREAVTEANKPVFLAIGNHDAGNSKTISLCGTDAQIYAQMVEPYIAGWDLTTTNEGTPHPSGKNYYFKDFTAEKIRMIVLYEYESERSVDPNDSTKYLYQIGIRAFSQTQIDWLIDSLLTTPEDYGVMIVKHQPENYRGTTDSTFNAISARGDSFGETFVSRNIICDIVKAFINKEHLETSYEQSGGIVTTLEVDADFSSKTTTEFICYLSGHSHIDGLGFLKDYPNQLELNIGCDNTHYIFYSDIAQSPNTISEDLINVYSIDRNNRKLCVVRIGANMSNMAQQRISEIFNY